MKKFAMIQVFLLLAIAVIAQQSRLVIRNADRTPFTVFVGNNKFMSSDGTMNITVAPGNHMVRVTKRIMVANRIQNVQVFNGNLQIPYASRVNARINNNNQFVIVSTTALGNQQQVITQNPYHNSGYYNQNTNTGYYNNGTYNPYANYGVYSNGQINNNNGYYYGNQSYTQSNTYQYGSTANIPVDNASCGPFAMSQHDFNHLIAVLRANSFENTKVNIAKQAIGNQALLVNQVMAILNEFTFERNKLELAKFAYANTIDKQYYYQVVNAFTFNSNKNELLNYINRF